MVLQSNPMDFISWYNPSQAFTAKHVSYPQLTATVGMMGHKNYMGGYVETALMYDFDEPPLT